MGVDGAFVRDPGLVTAAYVRTALVALLAAMAQDRGEDKVETRVSSSLFLAPFCPSSEVPGRCVHRTRWDARPDARSRRCYGGEAKTCGRMGLSWFLPLFSSRLGDLDRFESFLGICRLRIFLFSKRPSACCMRDARRPWIRRASRKQNAQGTNSRRPLGPPCGAPGYLDPAVCAGDGIVRMDKQRQHMHVNEGSGRLAVGG